MQITEDINSSKYQIKAYTRGEITVNNGKYRKSLIITPTTLWTEWPPATISDLAAVHLEPLIQLNPDIILLGTGNYFVMPPHSLLAPIYQAGLTIDPMDTGAACRTFVALSSENRNVAAALLIGQ